ncbi:MAG: glycoside hydrolase family 15 protein, partial [Acidobacteria bacterium]|nr:glycoside hydrolase family 15 protein [Acidobacteriota bacterium]
MPYLPIEDYGIIGNLRTVALVGINGSIDWYCSPNFDSPSVFGALLDDNKGGRFQIAPIADTVRHKQFYWPSTNILVTRFSHEDGIAELVDFMPVGFADDSPSYHQLHRTVRCVRGTVRLQVLCRPALDYGRASHEVQIRDGVATFNAGSGKDRFSLAANVPLKFQDGGGVSADFVLEEGQTKTFIFQNDDDVGTPTVFGGSEIEAKETFERTVKFWQDWLSSCTYRGRWRERIERSALALKLLTYEPTGAIVAAPTTSLPEVIGGSRNWDYRYAWVRDAAFTVYAFVRLGFTTEAAGFVNWLQNYVAKHPHTGEQLPTVFTIFGEQVPDEITLDHWEGYMGSGPVRIGNAANRQYQADIYGELMDSLYLYNKHVGPINYDFWVRIRHRLDWICDNWQLPDEGIWEMRSGQQNFVYSKLMNWVALDRGVRLADKRSFPANRARWLQCRDDIYVDVMHNGWSRQHQAFVQHYGSEALDASNLIMPLVFFMAPNDPRMLSTLDAVCKDPRDGGLLSNSLVYR